MKTLKNVALILYMLGKRIFNFADAYAALFLINFVAKVFQYECIFQKFNKIESLIFMIGFRIVFGYILLLVYDFIGRDLFEFGKEIPKEEVIKKRKSFFEKFYSKIPWLEKIVDLLITSIFKYTFLSKIVKSLWLKKFVKITKKIAFSFIEPIFLVIEARDEKNKFNGIKSFRVLKDYLISSILCSSSLYITFSAIITIF